MTAPDRIWAWVSGAGMARLAEWSGENHGFGTEYIRRDPAVLACDETVLAMIGAVVEDAVRKADGLGIPGHTVGMAVARNIASAIRAHRPDATAALARALQAERAKALEEARLVALRHSYGDHTVAKAIDALKEAP